MVKGIVYLKPEPPWRGRLTITGTSAAPAISGSLKSFDLIWAMTAGGPARYTEVLGIYLYQATFHYAVNPYGMGGAASVVIILISVFLIKLVEIAFRTFTRRME